jgi:hypothetical protein
VLVPGHLRWPNGAVRLGIAAIAVDTSGNVIVAGVSESSNFPHAGAVPSLSCQINNSCYFLASLKPDGSALNYSGQIGGSEGAYTNGTNGRLAVDASGNAYLAGITDSPNFQLTSGTLVPSITGYPNISTFVLKVDPTGKLLYSTAIPGNAAPNPLASFNNFFLPTGIAVDSSGQATVSGTGGPWASYNSRGSCGCLPEQCHECGESYRRLRPAVECHSVCY